MSLRRSARVSALKSSSLQGTFGPVNSAREPRTRNQGPSTPARLKRSASSVALPEEASNAKLPSTPSQKRQRRQSHEPTSTNATPSAVRFLAVPQTPADPHHATRPLTRPAEPHKTNALLVSPESSKVVAYSDEVIDSSPSKSNEPRPTTTTTGNILEEACAHLIRVDPSLKPLIEKHHCQIFSPEGLAEEIDPFRSLASGIIAQQVSGAAAKSIKNKFVALFNDDAAIDAPHVFPTPSQVAACDLARLRSAGLSGRKAEYIQGLAAKFASGDLSAEMLMRASDEEVLERLTAVRGLGRWSVEMFACFGLKRMDVFSTGDLGVQRGLAAYLGKDVKKLKAKGGKWKYVSEREMLDASAKFAPYRSLFMWYLWRIENVDVDAVQDE